MKRMPPPPMSGHDLMVKVCEVLEDGMPRVPLGDPLRLVFAEMLPPMQAALGRPVSTYPTHGPR